MDHNSEFGFVTMDKPHTLRSFAAYADWMKALHFSEPPPKVRLRFRSPCPLPICLELASSGLLILVSWWLEMLSQPPAPCSSRPLDVRHMGLNNDSRLA